MSMNLTFPHIPGVIFDTLKLPRVKKKILILGGSYISEKFHISNNLKLMFFFLITIICLSIIFIMQKKRSKLLDKFKKFIG